MNAEQIISRSDYDELRRKALSGEDYLYEKTIAEKRNRVTYRAYRIQSYDGKQYLHTSMIEYAVNGNYSGGNWFNVIRYSYDEFIERMNENFKHLKIYEAAEAEQLCLW